MMRSTTQPFAWAMISAAVLAMSGCAAFRPIPGIPASALPPEYHAVSRADESTIDLSLLAQVPPHQHYVDGGDVLGIYIEGVLGRPGEAPPITVPQSPDLPPAIGYPISVRDDGTLSLPMVGSIMVRGLTIRQVEEKLRYIYTTERDILRAGQDRIIVSLQRPRQVRVLVLRQESGGPGGTEFAANQAGERAGDRSANLSQRCLACVGTHGGPARPRCGEHDLHYPSPASTSCAGRSAAWVLSADSDPAVCPHAEFVLAVSHSLRFDKRPESSESGRHSTGCLRRRIPWAATGVASGTAAGRSGLHTPTRG